MAEADSETTTTGAATSRKPSASSDDDETLDGVEEEITKAQLLLDSLKAKTKKLLKDKSAKKKLKRCKKPTNILKTFVDSLKGISEELELENGVEDKEILNDTEKRVSDLCVEHNFDHSEVVADCANDTDADELLNGSENVENVEDKVFGSPKIGKIKLVNIASLMASPKLNDSLIVLSDSDDFNNTKKNSKKNSEDPLSLGEDKEKSEKKLLQKTKKGKNLDDNNKTSKVSKNKDPGESSGISVVKKKKLVSGPAPKSRKIVVESSEDSEDDKDDEDDENDSEEEPVNTRRSSRITRNTENNSKIDKKSTKEDLTNRKSGEESEKMKKDAPGKSNSPKNAENAENKEEKPIRPYKPRPKSKQTQHLSINSQSNSQKNSISNDSDEKEKDSDDEDTIDKYETHTPNIELRTESAIHNLSAASPSKSILKDLNRTASPDKRVQFSKEKIAIMLYPTEENTSSEESSSSQEDDNSDDEDFAVKKAPAPKKIPKSSNAAIEPPSIICSPKIKNDRKLFKKCFVNVNRINAKEYSNTDAPIVKSKSALTGIGRKSDTATVNSGSMGHPKRSRSKRDQENSSSDSDDKKIVSKKSKRNGNEKQINGETVEEVEDIHALSTEKENMTSPQNSDEENGKKTKRTKKAKIVNDSSNSSDSEIETKTTRRKKLTKRRVLTDSDESAADDDDNAESEKTNDNDDSSSSEDSEEVKATPKTTSKRSRIKKVADSSDEDEDNKTTRKQIRKVIARDSLAETTKQAERDERERKARIAERQQKYNNIYDAEALENSTLSKVVLDIDDKTEKEILSVHPHLVKHLKPHQGKGIQFMWDACFESLERVKTTEGSGCILAHCMGLGKTLQVISLIHTLIANRDESGVERVLVVCPLSTVLNWVAEFKKWLPDDDEVQVYNLTPFKQNKERVCHVMDWYRNGGALVLGYDMFRNLSNEANKRMPKKMRLDFQKALVDPGPHLVICDEGHLLKNEKTSISKAMNRLKTLRRIVLTGTPLQNNLKEYYCMVQFVKPNLLGTYKEYLNRFVNPITNGQYTDSTQHDQQVMRRRAHVLHKMLDGVVQRRDYSVLEPFLPPKHEYILFVSLTQAQVNLYSHYLTNFAQQSSGTRTSFLFTDFQEFQRICTHPRVLLDKSIQNKIAQEKRDWENEDDESEGSIKDFLDDSDSEAEAKSTSSNSGSEDEKPAKEKEKPESYRRRTRAMADTEPLVVPEEETPEDNTAGEWWSQFTAGDELDNIAHSGKLSVLFEILHQCEIIGDKVLIFSQSLYSLNVIEHFLSKIDEANQNGDFSMVKGYASSWSLGLDYFRLDGSSSCDNRANWCKVFNDPENTRARLFLISTRAGGLGINLVAANRVIIFDVSWNPSHDIQSIYRVYRFGQTKPCYIYRFVTMGTMEMKIYERQVTKQAISKRVIDEQQIDRHYNQNDLQELYKFDPEPEDRPLPAPPKDILLGELLINLPKLIYKYHIHQSLLENKEDEVLNEEERKAAWEEFENEKKLVRSTSGAHINNVPIHSIVNALTNIIKREHPTYTDMEINGVMSQLLAELRGQVANGDYGMFSKVLQEVKIIQASQQHRVQEYYQQQQQIWMMNQLRSQFPALAPSDIQKIIQAQMLNNFVPPAAAALAAAPTQHLPQQTPSTSSDVINLED